MVNQNRGKFYQFNIQNKFSLLPDNLSMGKLLVLMAVALLLFLSIVGIIVLRLI